MEDRILRQLKACVWLYFFLLIFEGAIRKWILPSMANPLLVIRDPVAIWMIFTALRYNVIRLNNYILITWAISILAFSLALLVGHGNIPVALFGLRITFIHFPVIFVIGALFGKEEVLKMGEILLWLNIGMTLLVAIQFFSPQSAFVNRGIGGDIEGSGFGGTADFYRVPGTFSFTNGLSFFYGLVAAYVFYFWLTRYREKGFKILLLFSTLALLAAVPLSISRTVLFEILLTFLFMLIISGKSVKVIPRIALTILAVGLLFLSLKEVPFFKTATSAFTERFTSANNIEGGMEGVVIDRFLGGMYGAITEESFPFWGLGLGMGTNVGAKIITGERGDGVFLVSEGEWGRVIGEMGVILGFTFILVRLSLVVYLIGRCWLAISRGEVLPWMLLSFGMLIILQGQWAQPTTLGFSVIIGGLTLASLKKV